MKAVADKCRESSRPAFVDIRTYRYKGHSMSDPRKYRTREEEEQYETQDPIERLAEHMTNDRGWSKDDYEALMREVKDEIRAAVEWADASPEPPISELYKDVYVEQWGPYAGTEPPQMLKDNA